MAASPDAFAAPRRLALTAVVSCAASVCLSIGLGTVLLLGAGGYSGPIHDTLPRVAVIGPLVTAVSGGISVLLIRRSAGHLWGSEFAWIAIATSAATESFALFLIALVKVVSTFGN